MVVIEYFRFFEATGGGLMELGGFDGATNPTPAITPLRPLPHDLRYTCSYASYDRYITYTISEQPHSPTEHDIFKKVFLTANSRIATQIIENSRTATQLFGNSRTAILIIST